MEFYSKIIEKVFIGFLLIITIYCTNMYLNQSIYTSLNSNAMDTMDTIDVIEEDIRFERKLLSRPEYAKCMSSLAGNNPFLWPSATTERLICMEEILNKLENN